MSKKKPELSKNQKYIKKNIGLLQETYQKKAYIAIKNGALVGRANSNKEELEARLQRGGFEESVLIVQVGELRKYLWDSKR